MICIHVIKAVFIRLLKIRISEHQILFAFVYDLSIKIYNFSKVVKKKI